MKTVCSGLLQKIANYIKVIHRKCWFYIEREDLLSLTDVQMKLILLVHVNNLINAVTEAQRTRNA